MRLRQYPAKAVKAIWDYVRKYGYVCYYTGMALNMTDPTSPWYCVFDHCSPHDPRKIVITCALVNEMKTDLNEKDFWYMIRQLASYRRWHTKVRKIRLAYWSRVAEEGINLRGQALLSPGYATCYGCGRRIVGNHRKFCTVCAALAHRLDLKKVPPQTVEAVWNYIRKYGYVCYYTGMPLDMTDPQNPWYCVFDHWIPGDPAKLVITSALVNLMKSDLTEDEFWYYVRQLADYKEKGKKIRKKKPAFWMRLYPIED